MPVYPVIYHDGRVGTIEVFDSHKNPWILHEALEGSIVGKRYLERYIMNHARGICIVYREVVHPERLHDLQRGRRLDEAIAAWERASEHMERLR